MEGSDNLLRVSSARLSSSNIWRNSGREVFSKSFRDEDDEEALKWAALERLPTYLRIQRGILTEEQGHAREINIKNLGVMERKNLLERLVKVAEEDNEKFLLKLKKRIDRVGIDLPTIEVQFEHLNVDAEAYVGGRALPTILNFSIHLFEGFLNYLHVLPSRKKPLSILHDVSGIIKPGRMTLLLGPPSSGKTSLLLALGGKLDSDLKVSGAVTYNGHGMNEFVPQRTSAYISQHDLHIGELTVRETLAFSARCQGVGACYDMLTELARREKEANIKPDADLGIYMKAVSLEGQRASVVTDYVLKILGLEVCADTMVGDEMVRGEMLVGPARALFMDEISIGLDSSTTYQIVNLIKQSIHILQGTAVTSKKDQEQYWAKRDEPYNFVTVNEFAEAFLSFHVGRKLGDELAIPFEKAKSHLAALTTKKYGVSKKELLKALISREYLLMKRNSFVYIFKFTQKTTADETVFMGALFYSIMMVMFNGFAELAMTILKIPIAFVEVGIWVFTTYYVIGFDPNVRRLFKMYLLFLFINQMAFGMFRLIGALGRNMIVANTFGSFALLGVLVLGGFILSRENIKKWWVWGYWASPLMYPQNAIAVNEFLGSSWRHVPAYSTESLGIIVLKSRGIFPEAYWYWIGVGASIGYIFLFNSLFTLALAYLKQRGDEVQRSASLTSATSRVGSISEFSQNRKCGMVLPFEPLSITFDDVRYAVNMPQAWSSYSSNGISGVGKTTLMDVLAGRKTGGYIEGSITISGYPKKQETFARVAGYCEQTDIHSPYVTIYDSLQYSAWLRLPPDIDSASKKMFVDEVVELVELTPFKEALVGLPGVNGLSTEQRKRLTIAVELVANPSIIFMDEPTSGLDARVAGINGISKIKDGYNPATWMLEVTSAAQESALGVNFAEMLKRYIFPYSILAGILHPMHGMPMETTLVILAKPAIQCSEVLVHNMHSSIVRDYLLGSRLQKGNTTRYLQCNGFYVCCCAISWHIKCRFSAARSYY
ncbi:hypothetical protein ACSBR2_036968 [Camellia fascicularis]